MSLNKLSTVAALLLFCASAHGTTRTAASCSSTDVQTAVAASTDGDTVLVPASTCLSGVTWTGANAVNITVGITLNGQGVSVTFAGSGTAAANGVLNITADTVANTFITGFTFNGAFTNGNFPIQITTTLSPLTKTYRFYNNTLNYTTGAQATWLGVIGNGPGLIDHNTFTTSATFMESIHFMGEAGNQGTWTSEDVVPGSLNYQYAETNTFVGPAGSGIGTMAYEAFNGARVVFRNNTLTNMGVDGHGFGSEAGNPTACTFVNTRWMEIYNNQFNLSGTTNLPDFITYRGGSGVVFGNTTTGTNGGAGDIRPNTDCNAGSYPILNQVGRGFNQNASPLYIWGNTAGKFPVNIYGNPLSSTVIQSGRDYFVSTGQPTTTRCQSAADVSAGCPVTYTYAPAAYPHPLVSASPLLTITPAPPIAFGNQNVSTTSAPSTITIANVGAANEVLLTPYFTITTGNAGDFQNTGGSCANAATIPPGSSCTWTGTFTPSAVGARSSLLTIQGTVNATASLTGTGTAAPIPVVTLGPRNVNFGTINTGSASANQLFTLTNSGTATLNYSSIASNDAVHFPLNIGGLGNPCTLAGSTLAAGVSCTFNGTFAPAAAGLQNATITVTSNASSSPDTIAVSGTGFTPAPNPPPAPAPVVLVNQQLPQVQPRVLTVSTTGTCTADSSCQYVLTCSNAPCSAATLLFVDWMLVPQTYANGAVNFSANLSGGTHSLLLVNLQ